MFFSTGAGAAVAVTDGLLEFVIERMKPSLRSNDVGTALGIAVAAVSDVILEGDASPTMKAYAASTPPHINWQYVAYAVVVVVLLGSWYHNHKVRVSAGCAPAAVWPSPHGCLIAAGTDLQRLLSTAAGD